MSVAQPRVVLLMGANGAGKARWTRRHRDELPDQFFNQEATTDWLGLCPDIAAARARCLAARASFGIETTSRGSGASACCAKQQRARTPST